MTPIQLKMTAFGPFHDTQTLDFNQLEGHSLFLITGKTGAGKTTIFDAISFALFGEPSGSLRQSKNFKSDFAGLDEECRVEFTFEVRRSAYTIIRTPRQQTVSTRTGEIIEKAASVGFWEGGTLRPIQAISEANKKIEELLGMNQEQFRTMALLPQGEFRKFLDAKSKDREEIFRKIFNTYQYENFTNYLLAQKDKWEESYKSCNAKLSNVLGPYISSISDPQLRLLADKEEQGGFFPQTVENRLRELKGELSKKQDELEKQLGSLIKEQEGLQLDKARDYYNKLDELKGHKETAASLSQNDPEMKNTAAFLRRTDGVVRLSFHQKNEKDARQKLVSLNAEQTAALKNQEKLAGEQSKATAALNAANKAKEEQQPLLEKSMKELDQIEEQYNSLAQSKQKERQLAQEIEKKNGQSEKIGLLRSRLEKRDAAKRDADCVKALDALQTAQKIVAQAAKGYLEAKGSYFSAYAQFLDGQAGILASQLAEDHPCPVCGSTHHPAKAKSPVNTPLQKEVEQMQSRMNAAQEASANALFQAKQSWQKADGLLAPNTLPEYDALTDEQLSAIQADWQTQAKESTAALAQAEKELAARLDPRFLDDPQFSNPEKLNAHARRLEDELAGKRGELKSVQEAIQSAQGKIPDAYPTLEALFREKAGIQGKIRDLDSRLKAAEKKLSELDKSSAGLAEQVKNRKQQIDDTKAAKENACREFEGIFAQLGYTDAAAYQADLSRLPQKDELQKQLDLFKEAQSNIRRLEQEISGCNFKPLTELEQRDTELTQQITEQKKQYDTVSYQAKLTETMLATWTGTRKELKTIEEKLTIAKTLADAASGKNSHRLSFERYIMTGFFDQFIDCANLRLLKMSSGRYSITRKLERADHGASSGLDLRVFDANTGKERETNTLSGGESFLTALSLALAVADVLTQHKGGVEINTMLIDEGFGSLDGDSLETVMEALQRLQAGSRLIGIISHVETLKHYIPVKLEVTAAQNGSSAKFIC